MSEAQGGRTLAVAAGVPPHAGLPVVMGGHPVEGARAAVILVHGRNATPENILPLGDVIGEDGVAYLAPAAAGHAWYPFSFMAPTEGNEPGISSGLSVLDGLVMGLEANGVPASRIVLAGFSQGACLATEFAVRHSRRFGGVVAYSGGLIGPPGTSWDYPGDFAGTPVFLGCSDVDPHIPLSRVNESDEVFRRMGADVTRRIYPGMGHLVNDDEIAFTQDLLRFVVG